MFACMVLYIYVCTHALIYLHKYTRLHTTFCCLSHSLSVFLSQSTGARTRMRMRARARARAHSLSLFLCLTQMLQETHCKMHDEKYLTYTNILSLLHTLTNTHTGVGGNALQNVRRKNAHTHTHTHTHTHRLFLSLCL